MEFEFKGQVHNFPSALHDITLGQRIDYHLKYGIAADERAAALANIQDEVDRGMETALWHLEEAVRHVAHYCGIDEDVLRTEAAIGDIAAVYHACMTVIREEEEGIGALTGPYQAMNETWVLAAPEVGPDNKTTFNEFLHAREITRQLYGLAKSRWEVLPHLCAVYLRHPGEPFSESLLTDVEPATGKTRVALMHDLPLDVALAVGFFLTGTMQICTSIFRSSIPEPPRASTPLATSTNGDGSAS